MLPWFASQGSVAADPLAAPPPCQVIDKSLEAQVLKSDNSSLARDCRRDMQQLNRYGWQTASMRHEPCLDSPNPPDIFELLGQCCRAIFWLPGLVVTASVGRHAPALQHSSTQLLGPMLV